ncbi:hypothetical protein D9M68_625490 [compost metagenome]
MEVAQELGGAAAGKEAGHGIGLERGDLGQQGLELHVREGQAEFLDDGAARGGVALLEAFIGLFARGVVPGDPYGLLVAAVHHGLAQRQRGLRVAERGAEHIGCALGTGGHVHTGVGDQAEHAAVARHLVDAHLHARVHRAHQHVDLVALHQAVGVFDALGRVGLIVHLEELHFATTELAALFVQRHAEAVFDRHAELRKRTGVGQHEADTHLVGLRHRHLRQQQATGRSTDHGGAAGKDFSAGGHGWSPVGGVYGPAQCMRVLRPCG